MTMGETTDNGPSMCRKIDGFIRYLGNALAWLNSALVITIIIQVILRYALDEGKIWMEELQWHLYGVCILFGVPYCMVLDSHVRLDLFHEHFSLKKKAYIELFGTLILTLPLVIALMPHAIDFVESSWRVSEKSAHPMGLPWRWLIKSAIPVSFAFIFAAAFSRIFRSVAIIFHTPGTKGRTGHGS